LDDALWVGTLTAAQVVTSFAHVLVGEVLVDFGGGAQIHLMGLTTLTGLSSDITIF
jgi:serralysin